LWLIHERREFVRAGVLATVEREHEHRTRLVEWFRMTTTAAYGRNPVERVDQTLDPRVDLGIVVIAARG
jgi:hypothetical protein